MLCWSMACVNPERCKVLRTCVVKLKLKADQQAREQALDAEINKRSEPVHDPLAELAKLIEQDDPFARKGPEDGEPLDTYRRRTRRRP